MERVRSEYGGVDAVAVRERIAALRGVCGAGALDVATRMLDRVAPAAPAVDVSEGVAV